MMIIEKMLPRALGRKLAVVSIERNLDSLGAELELEKMIARLIGEAEDEPDRTGEHQVEASLRAPDYR